MTKPVAVFAGYLVRYPLGGQLLSQLHYLLGLQQLGYEIVFLEHYGWPQSCFDPLATTMSDNPATGLATLRKLFEQFQLGRWCYVDAGENYHGMSRDEVLRACRESEFLLSVSSATWLEEFRECRTRIYVDGDPMFTQVRMPATPQPSCTGYASPYDFQFHFTAAERIGRPDCPIPTRGLRWRPTRTPVGLEFLQPQFTPAATRFTTVMSWSAYGTVEHAGVRYGNKDMEFAKFLDLPRRTGPVLEIALAGPDDATTQLREAGWIVTSALEATTDLDTYIRYLGNSRGEFSVAKNAYVQSRSGLMYERSANYLALGKPVVLQDTGFSEILPCGEGLFAFRTPDEAGAAIEEINRDYRRHCRAARRIAEEFFDARKILGAMLRECGLPATTSLPGRA